MQRLEGGRHAVLETVLGGLLHDRLVDKVSEILEELVGAGSRKVRVVRALQHVVPNLVRQETFGARIEVESLSEKSVSHELSSAQ